MTEDPEIDKLAEIFDTHKMDYPGIKPSDGELFDKVCDIARSRLRPKLPRVRPEGLEEGRLYWVRAKVDQIIYADEVCECCKMPDGSFEVDTRQGSWRADAVEIWGPIPEFELAD